MANPSRRRATRARTAPVSVDAVLFLRTTPAAPLPGSESYERARAAWRAYARSSGARPEIDLRPSSAPAWLLGTLVVALIVGAAWFGRSTEGPPARANPASRTNPPAAAVPAAAPVRSAPTGMPARAALPSAAVVVTPVGPTALAQEPTSVLEPAPQVAPFEAADVYAQHEGSLVARDTVLTDTRPTDTRPTGTRPTDTLPTDAPLARTVGAATASPAEAIVPAPRAVAAHGLHIDEIALGARQTAGTCDETAESFERRHGAYVHLCLRALHDRVRQRVVVLWKQGGRLVRRTFVPIVEQRAFRTRASLRLGTTAPSGRWTVEVRADDGQLLADTTFDVT